jgi:TetR/AcrR family transcriptional regulator, transcriptional repressor for nem operon
LLKVTKEKAAENRGALVRVASKKFRERGIDGVGVDEIAKCSGLTQGALYAQFESKQELAAEALAYGLDRSIDWMSTPKDGRPLGISEYLDMLVSRGQRDDIAGSCPMAASASEIARQDVGVSACFVKGFEQEAAIIEAVVQPTATKSTNRQRALTLLAAIIGGVAVARATAKADLALSDEILEAVRAVLGEIGGEAGAAS